MDVYEEALEMHKKFMGKNNTYGIADLMLIEKKAREITEGRA